MKIVMLPTNQSIPRLLFTPGGVFCTQGYPGINTDREFTHMTGRSHSPGILHSDRLSSSVGTCGTNAPAEVKKIQQLISGAGYRQSTGRTLKINGQCGQATIEGKDALASFILSIPQYRIYEDNRKRVRYLK